jgi:hypothetical protein
MTVPRKNAERRLLALVRDDLLSVEALTELQSQLRAILTEQKKSRVHAERARRKHQRELEAEIQRLVEAIATIGGSKALQERLQRAEKEREGLSHAAMKTIDAEALLASAMGNYRRLVLDLEASLERDREKARHLLREIFGEIRLVRENDAIYAEISEQALSKILIPAGSHSCNAVAGARSLTKRRIRLR